jgi:uncharacterized membrane protein
MKKKPSHQPAPSIHHEHDSAETLKMERMLLFTDAVFAIIMTLLALEVRLTDGADLKTTQGVINALLAASGNLAAYALSFVVTAMIWSTHLRRYRYVTAVSGRIIAGNIIQLLMTGIIPFATSMIARSTAPMVITFYAVIMSVNVLVGWVTWRIAIADTKHLSREFTPNMRREGDFRSLSVAALFILSIPIAFKSPTLAMLTWALQIPGNIIIQRVTVQRAAVAG